MRNRPVLEGSLRMRFARALALRIPAAAFGNLGLLITLLALTWSTVQLRAVAGGVVAWMAALTVWRVRIAGRAAALGETDTRRWLRDFGVSTTVAGVTWGGIGALWLALHALEPTSVLVMVTLAGVTAAATHVSSPSLPALRGFTLGALVPNVVVLLAYHRTAASSGLAVVLTLFAAFLWAQGGHMHADFLAAQVRAYRLEKQSLRLRDSREALRIQATRDGLTGALNRSAGLGALGRELLRATREQRPLSVVMLDLDHFKQINDTYGHAGGDAVLRAASARLQATLRPYDLFARFGGEEFVLVLPGCALGMGVRVAERLRLALAESPVIFGALPIEVTASFGVSLATAGETPEQVVARADDALYRAKAGGRNRVCAD